MCAQCRAFPQKLLDTWKNSAAYGRERKGGCRLFRSVSRVFRSQERPDIIDRGVKRIAKNIGGMGDLEVDKIVGTVANRHLGTVRSDADLISAANTETSKFKRWSTRRKSTKAAREEIRQSLNRNEIPREATVNQSQLVLRAILKKKHLTANTVERASSAFLQKNASGTLEARVSVRQNEIHRWAENRKTGKKLGSILENERNRMGAMLDSGDVSQDRHVFSTAEQRSLENRFALLEQKRLSSWNCFGKSKQSRSPLPADMQDLRAQIAFKRYQAGGHAPQPATSSERRRPPSPPSVPPAPAPAARPQNAAPPVRLPAPEANIRPQPPAAPPHHQQPAPPIRPQAAASTRPQYAAPPIRPQASDAPVRPQPPAAPPHHQQPAPSVRPQAHLRPAAHGGQRPFAQAVDDFRNAEAGVGHSAADLAAAARAAAPRQIRVLDQDDHVVEFRAEPASAENARREHAQRLGALPTPPPPPVQEPSKRTWLQRATGRNRPLSDISERSESST